MRRRTRHHWHIRRHHRSLSLQGYYTLLTLLFALSTWGTYVFAGGRWLVTTHH